MSQDLALHMAHFLLNNGAPQGVMLLDDQQVSGRLVGIMVHFHWRVCFGPNTPHPSSEGCGIAQLSCDPRFHRRQYPHGRAGFVPPGYYYPPVARKRFC